MFTLQGRDELVEGLRLDLQLLPRADRAQVRSELDRRVSFYLDACYSCAAGLHAECVKPTPFEDEENWLTCCCTFVPAEVDAGSYSERGVGRPMLDPDQITDKTSTGRKRAAALYPIFDGMTCQWAGLKAAGGGVVPIIGCSGNVIVNGKGPDKGDRHHGPDKNVINNSPSNVHLVCSTCHNRWHSLNNEFYGERPPAGQPYLPMQEWAEHDPITKATDDEREANEAWWALPKADRKLPLDKPAN